MEWYLKYKQASGIVSSKAWTTSLKTDTKIINSLRSNSMFFVSNTMHSYLRTGWFPAECLHLDIIHAGVLRFISFHLACVKLLCEDMIAGKARASGSRRLCPPPISPRQECVCAGEWYYGSYKDKCIYEICFSIPRPVAMFLWFCEPEKIR